ncbi:MAG: sensor histidine kinase [Xanthomonadaceae bacterium]|nr:sensor histidine kinase [Xanthomonadaceae bacterium]
MQARQTTAAGIGLIAFLALAGFALDRAFAETALSNMRQRLKSYAMAYADSIEFARDGSLYTPELGPDPRFHRPGSGLYAEVELPNDVHWLSLSAEGPVLPKADAMLKPAAESFEGPLSMIQIDGSQEQVFRYGIGLVWSERGPIAEFPYTIYIMEDAQTLDAQIRVFRAALWVYLGSAGVILLLLQTLILQWSLRPLRRVINELTKVQHGEAARMSQQHPRELEPLTENINAFIESERAGMERQRNTLADLAHSLKTPLAVLRSQLDNEVDQTTMCKELDIQLRKMNDLVSYQLMRAASSGHKLFSAPIPIEGTAEEIVRGLEKVYAAKGVLCEFEIAPEAKFHGEAGDLQELLGNLLENAFKWAHHRVLLTATPGPLSSNRRAGLLLAVDDDGPGIAPDDVTRVLQRGVRGDERVQGHGIGLSIVQDLIRDYRGELNVTYSEELGGARFEVRLPSVL